MEPAETELRILEDSESGAAELASDEQKNSQNSLGEELGIEPVDRWALQMLQIQKTVFQAFVELQMLQMSVQKLQKASDEMAVLQIRIFELQGFQNWLQKLEKAVVELEVLQMLQELQKAFAEMEVLQTVL